MNPDEYKSTPLEYFDLTDEEWEELGNNQEESLDFEFIGDTLNVTGFLRLNCYNYLISCTIHDEEIDVKVQALVSDEDLDMDCEVLRRVEAKLPGFKQGTYHISYGGQAPVEVVCGEHLADYRSFIEDGKVWTVKHMVETYNTYFLAHYAFSDDGEYVTVKGKPGKKMVCSYDYSLLDEAGISHPEIYGEDVGAFYEEGKRVYYAPLGKDKDAGGLLYDFEASVGDTIDVFATSFEHTFPMVVESKTMKESEHFKGICTQIRSVPHQTADGYAEEKDYALTDTWMEGVGGYQAPYENALYSALDGNHNILMACTVGDEVLYKHPDWNLDEETAEGKKRVDFTHVVKKQPNSPQRKAKQEGMSLSGEYSSQTLTIDLGTLHNAYAVSISNASDQTFYQKAVKTNSVVALNIDISAYPEGTYTITLENLQEVFTGTFTTSEANAIDTLLPSTTFHDNTWYNLTGRPVKGNLQRGIYIKDRQKIWIR